jgi:tRNA-Thr(GGU) m(6)t(6)A37 methyltransferase TsaA
MSDTLAKLKILIEYWVNHNREHIEENEKWLQRAREEGMDKLAHRIEHVIVLSRQVSEELERALEDLGKQEEGHAPHGHGHRHIQLHPIGVIRTPYIETAPFQPSEDAEGDFRIVLNREYAESLYRLDSFSYIHVLFFLEHRMGGYSSRVTPPQSGGKEVGLFASRSPARPNPIGLSVVRIRKIEDNVLHISGIDAYDGSPVLDIKPYVETLDSKIGAGNGWADEVSTGGK